MEKKEDIRQRKSKKIIKTTFLNLLQSTELHKITIKKLSDIAEINRGTFYLHYTDIYNLYESVQDEFFESIQNIFNEMYNNNDMLQLRTLILKKYFDFLYEEKETTIVLFKQNDSSRFTNKMTEFMKLNMQNVHSDFYKLHETQKNYFSTFVAYGIVGLSKEWIYNNFEPSSDEIVNMLCMIIDKVQKNIN